jgi:hypothetical protein
MAQKAVAPPFRPSDVGCDRSFKVRTSTLSYIYVCGIQECDVFLVLLLPFEQKLEAEGRIAMKVLTIIEGIVVVHRLKLMFVHWN